MTPRCAITFLKACVLVLPLGLFFLPSAVRADADRLGDFSAQGKEVVATQPPGSAASFDKRLPPVLPGEEINTGGGKMKVWSSSGPVSVGDAPEPGDRARREREEILHGGVGGVIVDQRRDGQIRENSPAQ